MRLAVCDDHTMFVDTLVWALTTLGHEVVAATDDPDQLASLVAASDPDACVLDVNFDGRSGLDCALVIRAANPEQAILLLTAAATGEVWRAYDDGLVNGLVNKVCDIAVLNDAIQRVGRHQRVVEGFTRPQVRRCPDPPGGLTPREQDVLSLLIGGASTEQMVHELGISANTVRSHVQNLLHKLGANGRRQAVHLAVERELVDLRTA